MLPWKQQLPYLLFSLSTLKAPGSLEISREHGAFRRMNSFNVTQHFPKRLLVNRCTWLYNLLYTDKTTGVLRS